MTQEKIVLGIDLGTTYSAMAYVDEDGVPKVLENDEGQRTTPSVVFFEESGNVIVGRQAKDSLVIEPLNGVELAKREIANLSSTANKRTWEIYDNTYTPEDISSLILKKIKQDASNKLGFEVTDAVITVPAYFDVPAREATRNAGILAGLNVVALLNEPEAAAIAFTREKLENQETIFVFDLGGGTFDVTILRYDGDKCEVLATDGDYQLGGTDFDQRVFDYVSKKAQEDDIDVHSEIEELQRLRDAVEVTKVALSSAQKKKIRVQRVQYEITREIYEQLIQDKLSECEVTMNKLLEEAKEKGVSGWEDIDRVILVGGSSRTPKVREMVTRVTGKSPDIALNPDEAVAIGAALYASLYKEIEEQLELEQEEGQITAEEVEDKKVLLLTGKVQSVCSHSIGIAALTQEQQQVNAIILKKNTSLPCEGEHIFGTFAANQVNAKICVLLGESSDPEQCSEIGKVVLELPGNLPKESPIRARLQYNLDGRLEVYAEDLKEGNTIEAVIDLRDQMSPEELENKKHELEEIEVQ